MGKKNRASRKRRQAAEEKTPITPAVEEPVSAGTAEITQAATAQPVWLSPRWIALALIVVTVIAYWQVGQFDFVAFDDQSYVYENDNVLAGLSLDGIRWAFTTGFFANWHPLTWLSHMTDVHFYGLDAGAHHMTNVLFHVVNTLLLFGVLRAMTGATGRSALVAALFAIHPLHVESVAWIAERKDVLSGLFFFLTIAAYSNYVRRPGIGRYIVVAVMLALGLMSKPMLVTLPCVLLLLDVWPLNRITPGKGFLAAAAKLFVEKLPLFALVVISSIVTVLAQAEGGAVRSLGEMSMGLRISNALVSWIVYIQNTIWPAGLAPMYPFPKSIPAWQPVLATVALIAVTVVAVRNARRMPWLPVGWFWFLGMLVPVIGIVQVGSQAMADRYTYLPMIGLFVIFAWGSYALLRKYARQPALIGAAASVPLVLVLCAATWSQTKIWTDTRTLWEHTLSVTTKNPRAHEAYASVLATDGEYQKAVTELDKAISYAPRYTEAHNERGAALANLGRNDDAIASYKRALNLEPDYGPALNNYGNALAARGDRAGAITQYRRVVALEPDNAISLNGLGAALVGEGSYVEAIAALKKAIAADESLVPAYVNIAGAYIRKGEFEKGQAAIDKGLKIEPDNERILLTHASVLKEVNQFDAALVQIERARTRAPRSAAVLHGLGQVRGALGESDAAIESYRKALKFDPTHLPSQNDLAVALAAKGDGSDALSHYRSVIEKNPDDAMAYVRLGSALDDKDDIDGAIAEYRKAIAINPKLASAHNNLAAAFARQGKVQEATDAMSEAARLEPGNESYRLNLGMLYRNIGDLSSAREQFEAVIKLNPASSVARQSLDTLTPRTAVTPGRE